MADALPTPAELTAWRERRGWGVRQCAEAARVAVRTWQQWESGDRRINATAWDLVRIRAGVLTP